MFQGGTVSVSAALGVQEGFRAALQAAEQWVLKSSFRLMSHNSLDVSGPTVTQHQIQQHQVREGEKGGRGREREGVREGERERQREKDRD